MADTMMINYQNAAQLSNKFKEASQKVKALHGRLSGQKQILQSGAWISDAATKFYKEMDLTLEGANRLSGALNLAGEVVGSRIVNLFKQAEENGKGAIPAPQD